MPQHEDPQPDKKISSAFMIEKIGALRPADIQNFRDKLGEVEQYMFDGESEDSQYVIVAIDNLNDAELETVLSSQKILMGVHDLDNYLTTVYAITLNPRYQKFADQQE